MIILIEYLYYESCPFGTNTINKSYFCEVLNCSKYYNYNGSEWVDDLKEGYYLNDTLNTIHKCDDKCQNCTLESTQKNLCTFISGESNNNKIHRNSFKKLMLQKIFLI